MNFDAFLGNSKIKQQLIFLTESGRLPHAILLEGDEGIGKRTLAKELALNLLCVNRDEAPCRACPQCSKVMKGIHPDVIELNASGGKDTYKVEDIRRVVEDASVMPNEAAYKIYIISNCQYMSPYAQNALLKVLEEPPAYVLFLLTVNNKSAMLETVLSRTVVIPLEGVAPKEGAQYLCDENPKLDYGEALRAIETLGGNIGRARESLADGALTRVSETAAAVAEALLNENEYALLKESAAFAGDRELIVSVMTLLKSLFRDALMSGGTDYMSGSPALAQRLATSISREGLLNLITAAERLRELAQKNCNNNILITKISYELRRAIGK